MSQRTPETVGDRYAANWLAARSDSIARYAEGASARAQAMIDAKAVMIQRWLAAVNGGKWEARLGRPEVSASLGQRYTDGVGRAVVTETHKRNVERMVRDARALGEGFGGADGWISYLFYLPGKRLAPPPGTPPIVRRKAWADATHKEFPRPLPSNLTGVLTPFYERAAAYLRDVWGWTFEDE